MLTASAGISTRDADQDCASMLHRNSFVPSQGSHLLNPVPVRQECGIQLLPSVCPLLSAPLTVAGIFGLLIQAAQAYVLLVALTLICEWYIASTNGHRAAGSPVSLDTSNFNAQPEWPPRYTTRLILSARFL